MRSTSFGNTKMSMYQFGDGTSQGPKIVASLVSGYLRPVARMTLLKWSVYPVGAWPTDSRPHLAAHHRSKPMPALARCLLITRSDSSDYRCSQGRGQNKEEALCFVPGPVIEEVMPGMGIPAASNISVAFFEVYHGLRKRFITARRAERGGLRANDHQKGHEIWKGEL